MVLGTSAFSQEENVGQWSGGFETNANVFLKDSSINAFGLPQYETQFFGGEAWLNLNYTINDLTAGVRFDMYNNSNLRDPNGSYTDQGLGIWFVRKKFDKFSFEVGNIYDQIGSGIIYRTYEERALFIDNSLLGVKLNYKVRDNINVKAFAGRQKNAFDLYGGNLKGIAAESFFSFGEETPISISPGIGFVNKTISEEAMERVVSALTTYLPGDRFAPRFNSYAATVYNSLNYKNFSWYVEVALKSEDTFFNPFAPKEELIGDPTFGKLQNNPGSVVSSTFSYSGEKLTLSVEGKRTQNFSFRVDPNLRLLRGLISYIPPMNRQNTYRLTARYSPATQEISELAFQIDAKYQFSKKWSALVNFSNIETIEGTQLFREFFSEVMYKPRTNLQISGGLQMVTYNQSIYEQKPEVPLVKTVTPYFDVLYKFDRKKSLRTEFQLMSTQQDYGSWIFGLAEFGLAPNWIFEVSGMFNYDPKIRLGNALTPQKIFYPTVGAVFIEGNKRFQLRYVQQVEGIVCSGGICRLEPAFSGIRFSANTNF